MFEEREVVTISYQDLVAGSSYGSDANSLLLAAVADAFGEDGLGIIAITGVPNFDELRSKLLPLSRRLADLSTDQLDEITSSESLYQVGWSYGKEKLEGGVFDTSKGSFYANPLTDNLYETIKQRDCHLCDGSYLNDLEQAAIKNPAFFSPNVWPSSTIPELEKTFKDMGLLIHRVGLMLARVCDSYVASQCPGYDSSLENILTKSKSCKGRLLHYFPFKSNKSENVTDVDDRQFSNWCGWHNDHGSLTGLVPAIYMNKDSSIIECPDKDAGLYVKSRKGLIIHVVFPKSSLAFQVGETAQMSTGGILKATPHAVRGCHTNSDGQFVTRESFAVFMEPEFHDQLKIPIGRTMSDAQSTHEESLLPKSVRPLRLRWKEGMNFGEFSDATFAAFY